MSRIGIGRLVVGAASIFALSCCTASAAVTLSWSFDGDDLSIHSANGGNGTLSYTNAATQAATSFGTTGVYPPHLPDGPSGYVHHGQLPNGGNAGYQLAYTGVLPNGGGAYVNDYTMISDVFLPRIDWTALFNTNPDNGNDADWYVASDGALGIGHYGYSPAGTIGANAWYRLGFVHDTTNGRVDYWVNGVNVASAAIGDVDGRYSLYSSLDAVTSHVNLHGEGDSSGNYTNEIYMNNFLFADYVFSSEHMRSLGGPTAAPIPEPSSVMLGIGAVLTLATLVKRKRASRR